MFKYLPIEQCHLPMIDCLNVKYGIHVIHATIYRMWQKNVTKFTATKFSRLECLFTNILSILFYHSRKKCLQLCNFEASTHSYVFRAIVFWCMKKIFTFQWQFEVVFIVFRFILNSGDGYIQSSIYGWRTLSFHKNRLSNSLRVLVSPVLESQATRLCIKITYFKNVLLGVCAAFRKYIIPFNRETCAYLIRSVSVVTWRIDYKQKSNK